jgi:hypothetical protein
MPDGSILWLSSEGANPREMVERDYNQMFLFFGASLIVGGIFCAVLVDPGKDREDLQSHTHHQVGQACH